MPPRRLMYHTQEKRARLLTAPVQCMRHDAWLGDGYYFWNDEMDAIHWGNKSKRNTGYYQVYSAHVDCDRVLDTVFNEEHYHFWLKMIEKAAKYIAELTNRKATIREVNQYFRDRTNWRNEVDGVMFQDLPSSDDLLVRGLNYRKRIQVVAYNINIIHNFALHFEMECV